MRASGWTISKGVKQAAGVYAPNARSAMPGWVICAKDVRRSLASVAVLRDQSAVASDDAVRKMPPWTLFEAAREQARNDQSLHRNGGAHGPLVIGYGRITLRPSNSWKICFVVEL